MIGGESRERGGAGAGGGANARVRIHLATGGGRVPAEQPLAVAVPSQMQRVCGIPVLSGLRFLLGFASGIISFTHCHLRRGLPRLPALALNLPRFSCLGHHAALRGCVLNARCSQSAWAFCFFLCRASDFDRQNCPRWDSDCSFRCCRLSAGLTGKKPAASLRSVSALPPAICRLLRSPRDSAAVHA